jgi:phosphoribosylformylglycinamidine synthase I
LKVSILEFPGSSGVQDAEYAFAEVLSLEVDIVWHQQEMVKETDLLVIPGGAAFGDYLRPGALAKSSPIVGAIRKCAKEGVPVIGIGNGFQILCELEILPGILLPNLSSEFLGNDVNICVDSIKGVWTKNLDPGTVLTMPLGCYCGRYFVDNRTIRDLEENERIAFRYCDSEGEVDLQNPFNGSMNSIAGIYNRHGNVLGIMPHPERAIETILKNDDGLKLLKALF